ncbi:MAG TPA: hypothetical protein VEC16_03140 [Alphaproteobacteria bacterium]|nr:hypothetical protein [Alphaproteobacteria bacterium]
MKRLVQNIKAHLGKRGFTYILVSTLITVVLLVFFFASSSYKYQDQTTLQQVRIRAMNDFVKDLNNDIHRATYISAFRAMLALEDNVATTGEYLTDINATFREAFFYGTINGSDSGIMLNSTFQDYLLRVQDMASNTGFGLDMNVSSIRIVQASPWVITVYMSINISIDDAKRTASWNISKEYSTDIPIENLRDPLYSKNTLNRVPNVIKQFNQSVLVNGSNVTNLETLIADSYYLESPDAPSFIMRFVGDTGSDPNGIESVVDIVDISDQDIEVDENAVKIDYIYFNSISTDKVCDVENLDPSYYFVIPSDRIALYQIGGLNYSVSCP